MARQRVQVQDLDAPDRLIVAPLQSDTFAAPQQPQIDNNMERLASALGFFGSKLQAYADDPSRKKALKEGQLAEWEKWKAARTSTEQLDAIRAGKAPYWADPFIGEVVKRDYAGLEAGSMADELDNEIQGGAIPKFGQPTFDPDAYIVEKAKSRVDRVGQDPASMAAFGNQLDQIRKGFRAKHEEALGVTQTQAIENVAYTQLDNVVTKAIEDGLDGVSISQGLKKIYKELGPRVKGGSLDIKYGRLDDIYLEVLQKKAKDPRFARKALELLEVERLGEDGQSRIGPLKDVARHSDKVAAIQSTAVKVLADEWETNIKNVTRERDLAALTSRDGSFSTIQDLKVTNGVDQSKTVSVAQTTRKEEAVQQFLTQTKAKNGGQPNFDEEFDVLLKNGVKHPEWIPFLQTTAVGIANTNVSAGPGPEQLQRIIQAADLYNKIGDRNHAYITGSETGVSKSAQDFYETYTTLVRYGNRTPEQAAIETARAFSSQQNAEDPMVVQGRLRDIESKARNMDFAEWWPGGGANNTGELTTRMIDLAKNLARVEGIDAETAIKSARDRIQASAVLINGRAVIDPGIQKGDEAWVQTILEEKHKLNAPRLSELGMSSASDLSIAPLRNGQYLVVNGRGGPPPTVPTYDKDGNITGVRPMVLTAADIQKVRAGGEEELKQKAIKNAVQYNSIKRELDDLQNSVIDAFMFRDPRKRKEAQ